MTFSTSWGQQTSLQSVGLPTTPNIDPSKFPDEVFELYSVPSYSEGEPELLPGRDIKSAKQVVRPDDILLCKIVPHLNRVWRVKSVGSRRQIASGEWIVVRSPTNAPDYLRYALTAPKFRENFMQTVSGVGGSLMRARPKAVAQIEIPIVSAEHQQRIVAKLDNLFARSRAAREELAHTPRLIERYKQAVLRAAFSGELTREWRKRNADLLRPKIATGKIDGRISALPNIPENWLWVAFASIASVSGGLTKNARRDSLPLRTPYLRVANVHANELRLEDTAIIGCTKAELEKSKLAAGDLLIVEGNGSLQHIGRVALWNGEIESCSHQNHLIRARPKECVTPTFALYWLLSPEGRSAIEQVASSSSGLHTLSISKVDALPIPICEAKEQQEIVRQIEAAFSSIDRLKTEAKSAATLVDRLDQAALAKAFRGELFNRTSAAKAT